MYYYDIYPEWEYWWPIPGEGFRSWQCTCDFTGVAADLSVALPHVTEKMRIIKIVVLIKTKLIETKWLADNEDFSIF